MMKKKNRFRTDFSGNEYEYFHAEEPEEDFLEKKRGEPFDFSPRHDSSGRDAAVDTFRPRVVARFPNLGPAGEGKDNRCFQKPRRFSFPIHSILLWTSGVVVGAVITAVVFLNGPLGDFLPKKAHSPSVPERNDFVVETSPAVEQVDLRRVVTAPNQPVADANSPAWDENSLESIPAWPGSAPSVLAASEPDRSPERTDVAAIKEEEKAPTFGDLLESRPNDSPPNDAPSIAARSMDSPQIDARQPALPADPGNPYEQFGASEARGERPETAALPSDIPTWNQLSTTQPPVFDRANGAENTREMETARPMKNDLVRFTPASANESVPAGDSFAPNNTANTAASANVFAPSNVSFPDSVPTKTEIAATDEFYRRASENVAAVPSGSAPMNEGSALSRTYNAPSAGSNFSGYRVTSENSTPNFTPVSGNPAGSGF